MTHLRIDPDRTFVTSDTHFGHKLTTRLRGFLPDEEENPDIIAAARAEHDEQIIEAWNTVVGSHDTVIHLGDVTFRGKGDTLAIFERLNGLIFIVPGNHDSPRVLRGLVGEDRILDPITTLRWNDDTGARDVVVSHFPLALWDGAEDGTPHLHGHLHTGLNGHRTAAPHGLPAVRRDVGVDAADHLHGQTRFAPVPILTAILP